MRVMRQHDEADGGRVEVSASERNSPRALLSKASATTYPHSATALMRPVCPPHKFDFAISCRSVRG